MHVGERLLGKMERISSGVVRRWAKRRSYGMTTKYKCSVRLEWCRSRRNADPCGDDNQSTERLLLSFRSEAEESAVWTSTPSSRCLEKAIAGWGNPASYCGLKKRLRVLLLVVVLPGGARRGGARDRLDGGLVDRRCGHCGGIGTCGNQDVVDLLGVVRAGEDLDA